MPGDDLLARLTTIGTTALCDADPAIAVVTGLVPVRPDTRMVGPARTVDCGGDLLPVLRGLDEAEPGEVLVVQTGGADLAVAGELFASEAVRRGLGGLVVDGYVRDLATLRSLDSPSTAGVCARPRATRWRWAGCRSRCSAGERRSRPATSSSGTPTD